MSSRQAVDRVKPWVRPFKTGHAGTLDPLAAGVLVVCVGAATRLIEYVQAMPKRYTGTFLLGRESETEDIEGDVRMLDDPPQPTETDLRAAAARFVGQIEQRPPSFSALKVGGRRAYDLARAGKQVELAPRRVSVYRLDVVRYEYPEIVLEIECGSGTYIRSLGRDLAASVGTAAVMSGLVRTAIGPFEIANAWLPERLGRDNMSDWLETPLQAVTAIDKVSLTAAEVERVRHGMAIHSPSRELAGEVAAVNEDGDLVAILTVKDDGTLRPSRNLV